MTSHSESLTFSTSIFLKSQWHQASKTLKNVFNFVKPALHVNKKFYISLTNIFIWSCWHSWLGNCLVWKINMCEKTFMLHGWHDSICWPSIYFVACAIMDINPTWLACDSNQTIFSGWVQDTGKLKNMTIFDSHEYERNVFPKLRRWLTTLSRIIKRK